MEMARDKKRRRAYACMPLCLAAFYAGKKDESGAAERIWDERYMGSNNWDGCMLYE